MNQTQLIKTELNAKSISSQNHSVKRKSISLRGRKPTSAKKINKKPPIPFLTSRKDIIDFLGSNPKYNPEFIIPKHMSISSVLVALKYHQLRQWGIRTLIMQFRDAFKEQYDVSLIPFPIMSYIVQHSMDIGINGANKALSTELNNSIKNKSAFHYITEIDGLKYVNALNELKIINQYVIDNPSKCEDKVHDKEVKMVYANIHKTFNICARRINYTSYLKEDGTTATKYTVKHRYLDLLRMKGSEMRAVLTAIAVVSVNNSMCEALPVQSFNAKRKSEFESGIGIITSAGKTVGKHDKDTNTAHYRTKANGLSLKKIAAITGLSDISYLSKILKLQKFVKIQPNTRIVPEGDKIFGKNVTKNVKSLDELNEFNDEIHKNDPRYSINIKGDVLRSLPNSYIPKMGYIQMKTRKGKFERHKNVYLAKAKRKECIRQNRPFRNNKEGKSSLKEVKENNTNLYNEFSGKAIKDIFYKPGHHCSCPAGSKVKNLGCNNCDLDCNIKELHKQLLTQNYLSNLSITNLLKKLPKLSGKFKKQITDYLKQIKKGSLIAHPECDDNTCDLRKMASNCQCGNTPPISAEDLENHPKCENLKQVIAEINKESEETVRIPDSFISGRTMTDKSLPSKGVGITKAGGKYTEKISNLEQTFLPNPAKICKKHSRLIKDLVRNPLNSRNKLKFTHPGWLQASIERIYHDISMYKDMIGYREDGSKYDYTITERAMLSNDKMIAEDYFALHGKNPVDEKISEIKKKIPMAKTVKIRPTTVNKKLRKSTRSIFDKRKKDYYECWVTPKDIIHDTPELREAIKKDFKEIDQPRLAIYTGDGFELTESDIIEEIGFLISDNRDKFESELSHNKSWNPSLHDYLKNDRKIMDQIIEYATDQSLPSFVKLYNAYIDEGSTLECTYEYTDTKLDERERLSKRTWTISGNDITDDMLKSKLMSNWKFGVISYESSARGNKYIHKYTKSHIPEIKVHKTSCKKPSTELTIEDIFG